ncbi:MAG: response regulator [Dethiobacteria bacterium]|nr:response regulator transcription factor [Bacillota bacterium]MDW7729573.1 response regulator transcription factor [Bacillota bacterium]
MEPLFLVVEDDSKIRNFIKFSLKSQEYNCFEASTGKAALDIISTEPVTTIILDLGLPDMDGLEIIKQVRTFSDVPIIVVSARDQDTEKVEALDAGADDYLSKPFSIKELLARIRVVLRHTSVLKNDGLAVYNLADLEIDLARHKVTLKGKEIHFTPIEFKVITLLLKNYGKVLTHNFILKEVWGSSIDNDVQSLRVFMANIRRKIEENPAEPRYIITEVGVGYRFADE